MLISSEHISMDKWVYLQTFASKISACIIRKQSQANGLIDIFIVFILFLLKTINQKQVSATDWPYTKSQDISLEGHIQVNRTEGVVSQKNDLTYRPEF